MYYRAIYNCGEGAETVVYHGYGRDGFETDGYGWQWAWKLRVREGTAVEAMGMGRDRVRHLSPCSSLANTIYKESNKHATVRTWSARYKRSIRSAI